MKAAKAASSSISARDAFATFRGGTITSCKFEVCSRVFFFFFVFVSSFGSRARGSPVSSPLALSEEDSAPFVFPVGVDSPRLPGNIFAKLSAIFCSISMRSGDPLLMTAFMSSSGSTLKS